MTTASGTPAPRFPSVDRLAGNSTALLLATRFGRSALIEAIRTELSSRRLDRLANRAESAADMTSESHILAAVDRRLEAAFRPHFRPVLNLTGTVLHTNLGRAVLPAEALEAIRATACGASNLEFNLEQGKRGDRDDHVEALLTSATGAEAATVVNNNAAAVLLVLNALALKREVPVSRGELIEIGGSFRIPDIMARAGCRLVEVGTTNRTHLSDFENAFNARTALVMKVHTSNYVVHGFTASVAEQDLAQLCHSREIPFVVDLGSGSLIDLSLYGLPHEPTPREAIEQGADLVLFSGDKLLGGPQAGIIVGKADLIARIKRCPLKRALRVDKMTMAALEAVLRIYMHPEQLQQRLPVLRMLTRTPAAIRSSALRLLPDVKASLANWADVSLVDCFSEIGSGAQPTRQLPSAGLSIAPHATGSGTARAKAKGSGAALIGLQAALRGLPVPVLGRLSKDALILDFRCLEDEALLTEQLRQLPMD